MSREGNEVTIRLGCFPNSNQQGLEIWFAFPKRITFLFFFKGLVAIGERSFIDFYGDMCNLSYFRSDVVMGHNLMSYVICIIVM